MPTPRSEKLNENKWKLVDGLLSVLVGQMKHVIMSFVLLISMLMLMLVIMLVVMVVIMVVMVVVIVVVVVIPVCVNGDQQS
jgi:hypothetical protein